MGRGRFSHGRETPIVGVELCWTLERLMRSETFPRAWGLVSVREAFRTQSDVLTPS